MITSIELNSEDMEEILKNMPPHIRKKIEAGIKEISRPDDGFHVLKHFVEQYDEENHLDGIVSYACASMIKAITTVSTNMANDRKKKGKKGLTGHDMAMIVSGCFRSEADRVDKAIKEECPIHGHKH